jgi:hypothetical protein
VRMGLLAIGSVLNNHGIYTCAYRDDGFYYIFLLLSVALAFAGFFVLATIFGFFPETLLPHFNLF